MCCYMLAIDMHIYVSYMPAYVLEVIRNICRNMQVYIYRNLQKYALNIQGYALTPLAQVWVLREDMQKYALNIQKYA
jgi:hypothetical protein